MQKDLEHKILSKIQEDRTFDEGFKLLVSSYQEKIYWHIRRLVHIHADADDVLQNTFIKVFKNIGSFRKEAQLYTWIYRIATNESLSFLKKRKDQLKVANAELYVDEYVQADKYFDADKAQMIIVKAIEQLPEKQKLIFNLRYYDEMSYKSISEILDTSIGGLKASYHHAAKKVEQYLLDNYNYSNG